MRLSFLLILGALVACGGGGGSDGGGGGTLGTAPRISNLTLSQASIPVNTGDGTAVITAFLDYTDPDLDISTIEVEISDGSSLSVDVPGGIPASGTLQGDITFSTAELGVFTATVWAVDRAGNTSNRLTVDFSIVLETSNWIERASGLAGELRGVEWSGSLFVAVGTQGLIVTSPDGIDWTTRSSGTTQRLNAVMWDGSQFLVVGDGATILTSPDGATWTSVNTGLNEEWLRGIAWSGSNHVAVGRLFGPNSIFVLNSPDGVNWTPNNSVMSSGRSATDIAWSGQQFVMTTMVNSFPNDSRVLTSVDGLTWAEVIISNESLSTLSITWDGSQFIAGGIVGRIHTSPDGVNWTQLDTPVSTNFFDVLSAASSILAHGNGQGVASTDGGANWSRFSMAVGYTGHGLAFGNNRVVSVGYIGPGQGGAIFSTQ